MITSGNARDVDVNGEAVLYSSERQQVMMHWEQQYMHECIDALRIHPSDRVLEIGFGLAYSATRIQHYQPQQHVIIECDVAVIRDAEAFATAHRGVEVLCGTWQSLLPTLQRERFDCVFFDDYPLPELERAGVTHNQVRTLRTRSRWHDFLDAALPLVAVGGRLSGYLARDIDLQRRGCGVEITQLRVAATPDCTYFARDTMLVPVITVLDAVAAASNTDKDNSSDSASESAGTHLLLLPSHVSSHVLQRVTTQCSSNSNQLDSPTSRHRSASETCAQSESSRLATPKKATTGPQASQRRRFADIRACLDEQELLDLVATGNDSDDSSICSTTTTIDSSRHYTDAATRTAFLAALRTKRRRNSQHM